MEVVEELSVAEVTHQCLGQFDDVLEKSKDDHDRWAENRRADFNLWADGVGAAARYKASLDARFASRPRELILTRSLLLRLNGYLKNFLSATDDKALKESKEYIDLAIENLAAIAIAIRQTGRRSRLIKADKRFDPTAQDELKTHLTCLILLRVTTSEEEVLSGGHRDHPQWWQREIKEELMPLQQRLIEANLRRRNRFLYAQAHSRGLASRPLPAQPLIQQNIVAQRPEPGQVMVLPIRKTDTVAGSESPATELPSLPANLALTFTGTSASIPASKLRWAEPQRSAPKAPQTQITAITRAAGYPKLSSRSHKHARPGQPKVLKCPCCCETLPAIMLEDSKAWKKHLSLDISPYTCIAQDCPAPEVLFDKRTEWEDHMKKHHVRTWKCQLCYDAEAVSFTNVDELTQHVRENHLDTIPQELLKSVALWPSYPLIGITQCPLCDSTGPQDAPELIDHVLEHTHDFALRSLPWADLPIRYCKSSSSGFFDLDYLQNSEPADLETPIAQWRMHVWFDNLELPDSEQWAAAKDALRRLARSHDDQVQDTPPGHFAANDYFASEADDPSLEMQNRAASLGSVSTNSLASMTGNSQLDAQGQGLDKDDDDALSLNKGARGKHRDLTCGHCHIPFDHVAELITHIEIQHTPIGFGDTTTYHCGTCPPEIRFRSRKDFRRHLTNEGVLPDRETSSGFEGDGPSGSKIDDLAYFIMPYQRNYRFIGRDDILTQLHRSLSARQHQGTRESRVVKPSIAIMIGPGGIGKTQIATEFAYRYQEEHQDHCVFWADASDPQQLRLSIANLAALLRQSPVYDVQAEPSLNLKRILEYPDMKPWLLIIDNVISELWASQIMLPVSPNGVTLITSRDSQSYIQVIQGSGALINVSAMPSVLSGQLLRFRGRDAEDQDKLLEKLENNPLAINLASAYMNFLAMTARLYLTKLRRVDKQWIASVCTVAAEVPVALTFLLAWEQISHLDPLAEGILSLMSVLAPQVVPVRCLLKFGERRSLSAQQVLSAIRLLRRYSLIDTSTLRMHPVVQCIARASLSSHGTLYKYWEEALVILWELFLQVPVEDRTLGDAYLPHAVEVSSHRRKDEVHRPRISDLLFRMAAHCSAVGLRADQARLNREAACLRAVSADEAHIIAASSMVSVEWHPVNMSSMRALIRSYFGQKMYSHAEELQVRLLEQIRAAFGRENLEYTLMLRDVAVTVMCQGRQTEALGMLDECVDLQIDVLTHEHSATRESLEMHRQWMEWFGKPE